MSIDIEKLIRLNKLISVHFRKKHIIVLDPKQREECGDNEELKEDIIYDPTEWTLPEKLHTYVENLSVSNNNFPSLRVVGNISTSPSCSLII